jgi:hypothetical protein
MDIENQRFSVGIWQVKPGKEKDFITTFSDFASWVFNRNLGAGEVYLPARFSAIKSLYHLRSLGKHPKD